jgi:hypothetical protein
MTLQINLHQEISSESLPINKTSSYMHTFPANLSKLVTMDRNHDVHVGKKHISTSQNSIYSSYIITSILTS